VADDDYPKSVETVNACHPELWQHYQACWTGEESDWAEDGFPVCQACRCYWAYLSQEAGRALDDYKEGDDEAQ
jgi:hypothetical protein